MSTHGVDDRRRQALGYGMGAQIDQGQPGCLGLIEAPRQ